MHPFSDLINWHPQDAIEKSGCFFVGGTYYTDADSQTTMTGQMYTEVYVPKVIKHEYPLVMIHGAAHTALNWVYTADGRPGWLYFFLQQGYIVYIADQPARGRSSYNALCDGKIENWSMEKVKKAMVGKEASIDPVNRPMTRFPEESFDTFYKMHVNMVQDRTWGQKAGSAAIISLLDEIGPAILITHSQSGPYGWAVCDARPELVKAVIALEPAGPPYPSDAVDPQTGFITGGMLVHVPLHFDPPVRADDPMRLVWSEPSGPYEKGGWLQSEPYRSLPNLSDIPVLILTSECSSHVAIDHLTAAALLQCGVKVEYLKLPDLDIHGNGHMMMIETNSDEIADVLLQWLNGKKLQP